MMPRRSLSASHHAWRARTNRPLGDRDRDCPRGWDQRGILRLTARGRLHDPRGGSQHRPARPTDLGSAVGNLGAPWYRAVLPLACHRGRGAAWLAHWPVKQTSRSTPLGKSRTYRGVFLWMLGWRWVDLGPPGVVTGIVSGIGRGLAAPDGRGRRS